MLLGCFQSSADRRRPQELAGNPSPARLRQPRIDLRVGHCGSEVVRIDPLDRYLDGSAFRRMKRFEPRLLEPVGSKFRVDRKTYAGDGQLV